MQKANKATNCVKWPGRLGPPTIMNKATNCVKWPGRLGPPTMAKNGRENAAKKRRKRKRSVRISLKKLGETKCLKAMLCPGRHRATKQIFKKGRKTCAKGPGWNTRCRPVNPEVEHQTLNLSLLSPAGNSTASMPTEPKGREEIQPILRFLREHWRHGI